MSGLKISLDGNHSVTRNSQPYQAVRNGFRAPVQHIAVYRGDNKVHESRAVPDAIPFRESRHDASRLFDRPAEWSRACVPRQLKCDSSLHVLLPAELTALFQCRSSLLLRPE